MPSFPFQPRTALPGTATGNVACRWQHRLGLVYPFVPGKLANFIWPTVERLRGLCHHLGSARRKRPGNTTGRLPAASP